MNQDNPQAIIQVRDLCNRFGAQAVHEHLDLDVRRGEILGVVGGSGTGKSVLLRSIVGLRRPTSGSVRVFGEDLLQLPEERRSLVERRFGVLFQQGALFSSLTVVENVALPLIENAGLPRADAEHLAQVKLALAGLPANAGDKYPASLSGGMIKRAALARALALDPDILFLDRPTAGLDPIGAAAFDNLIRTLRDALGLTVFLVTHDLDTLYTICDRVAVLSQKKVLVVDTLERVAATDDAWVREYFHGPRGRIARKPPPCRRITEMETRAHHVLIGLFSVIVIGAALLFGLWLAKSGSEGKFSYYDIVFNEAVSGLSQGSSVQYSGIKVGDVAFLRLDPKDPRKVWARIRVVASAPIKQDTTAKLALTGITGTSIIQLSSGTPASPMLEGRDRKIPVIVATPSPLTQLLSNGEDLMGNINQLIARFSNLLSEENTARISRTLDHLDQATGALSAERENVSAVMQQLAQASRQANAALAQASELMRSANGLLNEQGKGMLENASKTMASLERTSATLDQLISENRHSLDGGIQGLAELGPAVSELRDTLAALRGISRRLEENPANYLLGREKTKEFTP